MIAPRCRPFPTLLDATDEFAAIEVRGLGAVGLQLTGTWAGTVSFEATITGDWADAVAFNMVPSASATAASSATANGAWSANCAAYSLVRARFSTVTSGTVRAHLQGADAPGRF